MPKDKVWIAYRTLRLRIDDLFRLLIAMLLVVMCIYLDAIGETTLAGILFFFGGLGVWSSYETARTRREFHL